MGSLRKLAPWYGLMIMLSLCISFPTSAAEPDDLTNAEIFWGGNVAPLTDVPEKVFDGDTDYGDSDYGNFSYNTGVTNWRVEDNLLKFTMTGTSCTLGWGYYNGSVQEMEDVNDMWEEQNHITIRIKGSTTNSKSLQTQLYGAGSSSNKPAPTTTNFSGSTMQEVYMAQSTSGICFPTPDGFQLVITGTAGEQFEIDWVKLTQDRTAGYVRDEFTLPAGTVWRAIADVGGAPEYLWYGWNKITQKLYINGEEVRRNQAEYLYHTNSVDISSYLQTGANCIAFYGYRVRYKPFIYFQCRIIMVDGTELEWDTDTSTWKASDTYAAGWNDTGFNDSGWDTPQTSYPVYANVRGESDEVAMAAYAGPIDIQNPDTNKRNLFYEEGTDVLFDVYIPSGLDTPTPSLKYYVRNTDTDGTEGTLIESDTITSYSTVGNSLKFSIDLGDAYADGVYTISFELMDDTTPTAERSREPFVVLANHNPDPIEGTDYKEALDLTLEDTIDFTDSGESHANMEYRAAQPSTLVSTPHIETLANGLQYREVTYDERGSFFTYRFDIDHVGDFYLVEVDYPDNDDRLIEISISHKAENEWDNTICGIGAETGRTFYRSNGMKTISSIFRATHDTAYSIDIANGENDLRSAAAGMRLYRINGDLPVVRMGAERTFGIHTERTMLDSGIGNNFGLAKSSPNTGTLMSRYVQDLQWMKETFDHYIQYMKFAGQNMHIMGGYQYMNRNTPAMLINHTKSARMPHCFRAFLANELEINDLDFYLGMEFSHYRGECAALNTNSQVAQGADTCWMVYETGQQNATSTLSSTVQNFMIPDVQDKFFDYMDAWGMQYKQFTHFKGVHNESGPAGHPIGYWAPGFVMGHSTNADYTDPLAFSLDDYTFDLFETEESIDLGVTATNEDRFADRKTALEGNSTWRNAFYAWRCDKYAEFLEDAIAVLQAQDADLVFLNDLMIEDNKFFKDYLNYTGDYEDFLITMGYDFTDLHAVTDLWTGRWTISFKESWRSSLQYSQSPYLWLNKYEPDITEAYSTSTNRYVFVRASWDENQAASTGNYTNVVNATLTSGSDWIMNCYRLRIEPQPAGFQCREPMIAAMITGDPELMIFGWTDLGINLGNEQMHRTFSKIFSQLPKEKFGDVLSTDQYSNMVIRELVKGTDTYFYMLNPGYWPLEATVTLDENSTTLNLATNDNATLTANGANYDLEVVLEPYGIAAYKVSSNTADVVSYSNEDIPYQELEALEELWDNADGIMSNSTVRSALSAAELTLLDGKIDDSETALAAGDYTEAWRLLNEIPVYLDLNDVDWKDLGFFDQTVVTVPGTQQLGFAWAEDSNVAPGSLTFDSDDTTLIDAVIGDTYILAMQLAYNGAETAANYTLQYKETGGVWVEVTSSSTDWQSDASQLLGNPTDLSDGDAISTSDLAHADPADTGYDPANGEFCNDGTVAGAAYADADFTEIWYAIEPTSSASGKGYIFRVVKSDDDVTYLLNASANVEVGTPVDEVNQSGYSWATDSDVAPGSLSFGSGDTTLTAADAGTTYILAMQLAYDGAEAAGDYTLEYKETSGAWTTITTSSTDWQADTAQLLGNPTDLNDGDAIATGDFVNAAEAGYTAAAGEFCNDGTVAGAAYSDADSTEIWYAIEPQTAAQGNSYTFRIVKSSATFDYDVYASASVAAAPADEVNQSGYSWATDSDVAPGSLSFGSDDATLSGAEAYQIYILSMQLAYDGAEGSGDYTLEYKETSGSWTTVTTSSAEWQADPAQLLGNPTDLSDGDAISTSDFANAGAGGYTAANGEFCNDGTVAGAAYSDAYSTEIWFAIAPTSGAEGKSYTFRIVKSGATFVYDVYASASVASGGSSGGPTDYELYLKLDETTGSTAYDESANENDGTLVGDADWDSSGHSDGCVTLDGTGDYINCGNDSSLQFGTAITVTAWIKTSSATQYQVIAAKADGASSTDGFSLFLNNGQLNSRIYNSGDHNWGFGPTDLDDGEWHFVCFYSSSTERGGWVDDTEYTTTAVAYLAETGYDLLVGNIAGYEFNGEIDEVRVYDYVLTDAEVGEVYAGESSEQVNQSGYSWATDSDVAPGSLSFGSDDTTLSAAVVDTTYILSTQLAYDGAEAAGDYTLEYKETSGSWTTITTSSTDWQADTAQLLGNPTDLSDGDAIATGDFANAAESGYTAAAGEFCNDGTVAGAAYSDLDSTEIWYAIKPTASAEGNSYTFRIVKSGATFSYDAYGSASVQADQVSQSGYSWATDSDVAPGSLSFGSDDTTLSGATSGQIYILATQLAYDNAEGAGDYTLEYKETSGAWTTITTSSTDWQADTAQLLGNPTDLSDGDAIATGDFANAAESGYTAAAGEFCNDGTVAGAAYSDADSTEIWYALKPKTAAEGKSYTFRIIKSGSTFSYDTYASASVAAASSGPTDYVLYLELDETSGSTAYDESANSNDGALVGNATWDASGHLNGCVTLDGSSDNVNCGSDASLEFGSAITVTAWVKTSSAATYQGIAGKLGGRSPAAGFAFFLSSGQCRLYLFNSGSNSWVYGPTDLDDGSWHFVCFYSSSTERGGWVDDTEYTTTAVAYLAESSYDFIIGDAVGDFNGEIDDVRVYDYVLTDAEVQAISGL